LKERVGEAYDLIVASVVPFGLFVRVPELQVDGLIHVTSLPKDYYHRDPTGTALTGERSGARYRLTDSLRVKLVAVNVEERKIDFIPLEDSAPRDAEAPARARRKRRRG
jgi:ribonuclease R